MYVRSEVFLVFSTATVVIPERTDFKMTDSGPTLTSLAKQISDITATITKHLEEKKLTAPSFAADSPTSFPEISPELFHQRQVLLDAINDLAILVQGPSESVFNYVHTVRTSYFVVWSFTDHH